MPQKNFKKKFLRKKSTFSGFQNIFWGTSGRKFEKVARQFCLEFYVDSDAKRIRALAAIPKNRKNLNAGLKKSDHIQSLTTRSDSRAR